MARTFTTWTADTCGCKIEYYNDDQSYRGTVFACSKHAAVSGTEGHLASVLQHNRTRNYVVNELIETHGLQLGEDQVIIGYDPKADKNNDPVLIFGAGELVKKNKTSAKTDDDLIDAVKKKTSINIVKTDNVGSFDK